MAEMSAPVRYEDSCGPAELGLGISVSASMSWLPDNVLLEVLGFLSVRDLIRSGRVCKRWKRLVMDKTLWRYVDLTPYKLNSKILWHLVRHCIGTNLQTLKVKGLLNSVSKQEFLTPAVLQVIEKRYSSLEKLHLEETNLRSLSYECFPSSLKTLELFQCEIPLTWFRTSQSKNKSLPNLENLNLRNVSSFSDHLFQTICKLSSLKTLCLSGTYRVTDIGIQNAVPYLKGLQHLKLHDCNITNITLHLIGCHLKHLRSLALRNFGSLTDAGLSCLSDVKTLEKLWLNCCFRLSSNCIISVCGNLPFLSYLNLNGILFEGQGLEEIRKSLPNCRITNSVSDVDTMFKL
ncbi:F-box LRR-repeat 12 [Pelobates cultripes]|uniref:F-box LRR-repeat 12 n=1 Tax=Pelobates cultripes TaxID=61616 RepID=A0AAD1VXE1_PELCU|nr:F-box LRR-repeat 12 [Pelobates cultripes]